MRFILQTWCQIQRTSSRLRCVNCGPGHIQGIYSSAYWGFNYSAVGFCAAMVDITWIQCALYCKLCAKYSAQPLFTLCELWCRPYTMHLQLRIFRLHYSSQGRSPAIGGISSIQWALYCKVGANYSPHPTVYAMWTVVPDIYNVFTAPHIQALIYDRKYLRCYWR
jgi:hypothetical protein